MLETLSTEMIECILEQLPMDITFVDADDIVRYYSHGENGIFKRTPSIIGSKVQSCHSPDSVHLVQQILNDFRSGKRDVFRFWKNLQGRLVYIRYFAVRDKDNNYQGILEATQDITDIKQIEGEKLILE